MKGILYLCPTPIGNLKDITLRTLETLKSVDLVAAEDTRNTGLLLERYEIKKPLISYHKFNEQQRSRELIRRLEGGESIALVSDAGMPGISDPGEVLVRLCHEAKITVAALPGASAFVTALAQSGLSSRRFVFEGFLPEDRREREEVLSALKESRYTTIFYEAPHRLLKTLAVLEPVCGARRAAVVRELTKKFEETLLGTIPELKAHFEATEPKGELVILIEGFSREEILARSRAGFREMDLEEHMALYGELPEKEAMKKVAKDRGLSRRDIYEQLKKKGDPGDNAPLE